MSKQITREELNQLLEERADLVLTELDLKKTFSNSKDKLENIVQKFMKLGANVLAGVSLGAVGGALVYAYRYGFEWLYRSIILKIPFEFRQNLFQDSGFSEIMKDTYEVLKESFNQTYIQNGMVIGLISALSFVILRGIYKSRKKAKQKVHSNLKKNDQLNKTQQRVCNTIADSVYK